MYVNIVHFMKLRYCYETIREKSGNLSTLYEIVKRPRPKSSKRVRQARAKRVK